MDNKRLLISLYEGCQYHCTFCMYGYVKEFQPLSDKDTMSSERWHEVLSAARKKGFSELEIGGRGEPTLNPVFTKVVKSAHQLGYRVELLSNALNDKAIVEIIPLIRQLSINLNVVDKHGMEVIHQPSPGFTFERCIASVKKVVRAVSEQNPEINLRTNYVMTTQSLKDAFSFPSEVRKLLSPELGNLSLKINYQHVHNYIKTPEYLGFDLNGLQKVLLLARLHSRQKFLIENTNLLEFIRKTEKLIERLMPFSKEPAGKAPGCAKHYTCDVHKYLVFIDGNGDCYGCYNPFRAVNGLPIDQDPFFFGNLMRKDFDEIAAERNDFNPSMDISKSYWRPCLLCKAVEAPSPV